VYQTVMQHSKSAARNWELVLRLLTSERGPWRTEGVTNETIILKLDEAENGIRMRKRLKRDYEGIDHQGATIEAIKLRVPQQSPFLNSQRGKHPDEPEEKELDAEALVLEDTPKHKILVDMECEFIRPMNAIAGSVELTSTHIYFIDSQGSSRKQWLLENILKVFGRRYVLRWTAVELFMQNKRSYFFNFVSHHAAA
jgi:hypothetical protein